MRKMVLSVLVVTMAVAASFNFAQQQQQGDGIQVKLYPNAVVCPETQGATAVMAALEIAKLDDPRPKEEVPNDNPPPAIEWTIDPNDANTKITGTNLTAQVDIKRSEPGVYNFVATATITWKRKGLADVVVVKKAPFTFKFVRIESFSYAPNPLPADGVAISTPAIIVNPASEAGNIRYKITSQAKGCSIDETSGVVTAGIQTGTITVQAYHKESAYQVNKDTTITLQGATTNPALAMKIIPFGVDTTLPNPEGWGPQNSNKRIENSTAFLFGCLQEQTPSGLFAFRAEFLDSPQYSQYTDPDRIKWTLGDGDFIEKSGLNITGIPQWPTMKQQAKGKGAPAGKYILFSVGPTLPAANKFFTPRLKAEYIDANDKPVAGMTASTTLKLFYKRLAMEHPADPTNGIRVAKTIANWFFYWAKEGDPGVCMYSRNQTDPKADGVAKWALQYENKPGENYNPGAWYSEKTDTITLYNALVLKYDQIKTYTFPENDQSIPTNTGLNLALVQGFVINVPTIPDMANALFAHEATHKILCKMNWPENPNNKEKWAQEIKKLEAEVAKLSKQIDVLRGQIQTIDEKLADPKLTDAQKDALQKQKAALAAQLNKAIDDYKIAQNELMRQKLLYKVGAVNSDTDCVPDEWERQVGTNHQRHDSIGNAIASQVGSGASKAAPDHEYYAVMSTAKIFGQGESLGKIIYNGIMPDRAKIENDWSCRGVNWQGMGK